MMMSEITSAALEPFWKAELDYRQERARDSYGHGAAGNGGRRRLRIRRRPTLKLPEPGRRPVAVA